MNDRVDYRLGVLSVKLKEYEREEDLVRLVEQINKRNKEQRYKNDGLFAEDDEDGHVF